MDEIRHIESLIVVKPEKFDKELKKLTANINELRNNDRAFTEWCSVTDARLELILNTCDRIENKCQEKDDEMDTFSINSINLQLMNLKESVLYIVKNANDFEAHIQRSNNERQKLKDEIIAQVTQINKNYELNLHIPRSSTPLTDEKPSLKESFTSFIGENVISERNIPKLEEWPTLSDEGEHNHIVFIRKIDMFEEDFHIPDKMIVGKLHSLFTRAAKKWY
ncbi:hypothetical protein O181_078122 [Austropuccinia psidii MF-1]|uniref:Uncharacterized protein n=1 Tax=Austropuccinia psidii MF-1 TaxID=1389203 RepID=A0A9Q3IFA9_9BASI|nr:hypothetical protein [Austropuccinia psidii MF-1]